jgi:ribosomal protein L7Ae-like RNA K-turn-binding protein
LLVIVIERRTSGRIVDEKENLMAAIRVVLVGMGPLGRKTTQFMMERGNKVKLVGAIDTDPDLVGQRVSDVCGLEKKSPMKIVGSIKDLPKTANPDVALLTTVSDMPRITKQIEEYAGKGLHVVSTCEELSFPWKAAPRWANRIDKFAKKKKVAVLGTGINPCGARNRNQSWFPDGLLAYHHDGSQPARGQSESVARPGRQVPAHPVSEEDRCWPNAGRVRGQA